MTKQKDRDDLFLKRNLIRYKMRELMDIIEESCNEETVAMINGKVLPKVLDTTTHQLDLSEKSKYVVGNIVRYADFSKENISNDCMTTCRTENSTHIGFMKSDQRVSESIEKFTWCKLEV